jgi:hypothetical protein
MSLGFGGRVASHFVLIVLARGSLDPDLSRHCERQIQAIHASKVVNGDPAEREGKLLEEWDAIENERGGGVFSRPMTNRCQRDGAA